MSPHQIFLLSPARLDGKRAKILLSERAAFPLALALREPAGAPLGDVFSFLSGLYFRGKIAYATAFARAWHDVSPVRIITTNRGLLAPDERVRPADLIAFSRVDIAVADERFRAPLRRDAEQLARELEARGNVVLLGSIATGKYVDILLGVFGERLLFPIDFVGRGDMSRGGLMLRAAQASRELPYASVTTTIRHGSRPPKLEPVR